MVQIQDMSQLYLSTKIIVIIWKKYQDFTVQTYGRRFFTRRYYIELRGCLSHYINLVFSEILQSINQLAYHTNC